MAKVKTKAQVVSLRSNGLKHFDKALTIKSRQELINDAVTIATQFPDIWGSGWSNFVWAFGNAVAETLNTKRDISQSYNLDEALTDVELQQVANTLKITDTLTPTWPRK